MQYLLGMLFQGDEEKKLTGETLPCMDRLFVHNLPEDEVFS